MATQGHLPVMLDEVLAYVEPRPHGRYLDCTFGGGGYARAILNAAPCLLWAIDRDFSAIKRGFKLSREYIAQRGYSPLHMLNGTFGHIASLCTQAGQRQFDGIVMDLGVSSYQIDDPKRGFSFKKDGPLDMRMGCNGKSAQDVINQSSEEELADIFYHYGEERHSRRVARFIIEQRQISPINDTTRLANIIRSAIPHKKHSKIDPATRVFQALRIAVNDELNELEAGLKGALSLLAPGGRLVVVSFHSLEDRIVKRIFKEVTKTKPKVSRYVPLPYEENDSKEIYHLLTRKIVTPQEHEIQHNPRSRSALLRAIVRTQDVSQQGDVLC